MNEQSEIFSISSINEKKLHAMTSSQASSKKRKGHEREVTFNRLFGKGSEQINYSGPSPDCLITNQTLRDFLSSELDVSAFSVSLKGGNTTQIHLGWIPELTDKKTWMASLTKISIKGKMVTTSDHGKTIDEQTNILRSEPFWKKYLGKGDILCYTNDNDCWWFFDMSRVIRFIASNFSWRLLETGRLKGDFTKSGKQIFTYEFRPEDHKKTFVLGAHGGQKGREFRDLLIREIPYSKAITSSDTKEFQLVTEI